MAGRPRKPTALKVVTGTARKDRTNAKEPKPAKADKSIPKDLDQNLHVYWNEYRPLLDGCGVLTQADITALRLLCQARFYMEEYKRELATNGAICMTPNGFPVQSPYVQLYNKAFDQLNKMLIEFGMTPSSRSKVTAIEKETGSDPWADLANG